MVDHPAYSRVRRSLTLNEAFALPLVPCANVGKATSKTRVTVAILLIMMVILLQYEPERALDLAALVGVLGVQVFERMMAIVAERFRMIEQLLRSGRMLALQCDQRSEERRVGKEGRSR